VAFSAALAAPRTPGAAAALEKKSDRKNGQVNKPRSAANEGREIG